MKGRTAQWRAGTLLSLALVLLPAACAEPAAGPASGAVTYERHGGIAGENTRLTITPDGTATLDSRAGARHASWTRPLSADEWRTLRASLDAARFQTLNARYGSPGYCHDCFVDTVRYRGRAVTVEGAAAPDRLSAAMRMLDRLART